MYSFKSKFSTTRRIIGLVLTVLMLKTGFAMGADAEAGSLQALIDEAIRSQKKELELPANTTYRLTKTLFISNARDFALKANNSTILMTVPGEALSISKSVNLQIKGLNVDYDPLPFTQGTVTSTAEDGTSLELVIHEGYPLLKPDMAAGVPRHFFDPKTRQWKQNSNFFNHAQLNISADGHKAKATFPQPQVDVKVGDLIAFDRRGLDRFAAVSIKKCSDVELQDVHIFAAPGLAFVGRHNKGRVTFRGVKIERGPKPVGATEERLLSSNADGVNFAYCRVGPILENCDFSYMGDDSLNVHGTFAPVLRIKSPTELIVALPRKPEDTWSSMEEGDEVISLEEGAFGVVGKSRLKMVDALPSREDVTLKEIAQCFAEYKNPTAPYTLYQITLTQPLPGIKRGQWLEFPSTGCPRFIVRNSYFHDHRARGLRIMACGGIVEGNRFERIGSSAIQAGPELKYWREAGWVRGLRIAKNQIRNIGFSGELLGPGSYNPGAIAVCIRNDKGTPPWPRGNEDIAIEENVIEDCPVSGIHAYGANRLIIRNNILRRVATQPSSESGKANQLYCQKAIDLDGVSNPEISGNEVRD